MKNATDAPQFSWLRLDRRTRLAVHRQVYERIRDAIMNGTLAPGVRLPSSRNFASQLGVARGTVELAYDLLSGEGYIVGRGPAGTVVDPALATRAPLAEKGRRRPDRSFEASEPTLVIPAPPRPFQLGVPAFDVFPRKLWSRLAVRRVRGLSTMGLVYQDSVGYLPLRQAIVNYLAIARGISCMIDQVFITAGYQGALGLIAQVLLERGDLLWMEDPGYFRARQALALAGAKLVPVPVDKEGLDVGAGIARAPQARFVVVTPSHQSPLGVTLSLSRRLALLGWANQAGAWIIEDDYDSEFRYQGRPLPALKSLDEAGRVLYVGSFSKVLVPSLRLGYLVVPESEVERFTRACLLLSPSQSLLDQMTVTDFLVQGHFGRHIKRMRRLYAERRAALAHALGEAFGPRAHIELQAGGMHLVMQLDGVEDREDVELARRARAHGLAPGALSPWGIEVPCGPALLLGFTNIQMETAAQEARRLRRALFDDD